MKKAFNNKYIFAVLVLIVISYNVIWDVFYYTIGISIVQQNLIRTYSLIIGSLILILVYISLCRVLGDREKNIPIGNEDAFFYGCILFMVVYGLLIGIVNGNNIYYLIGDTYKLIILPAVYYLYKHNLDEIDAKRLFNILICCIIFSSVIDVIQRLPNMNSSFVRKEDPFWISNILAYSYIIAFMKYGKLSIMKWTTLLFIITTVTLSSILSFHRSIFIVIAILFLISLGRNINYYKNLVVVTVGFILVLNFLAINPLTGHFVKSNFANAVSIMGVRFTNLFNYKGASSASVKVEEAITIIEELNKNRINWVMGMGSGAEYIPRSRILLDAPGYVRFMEKKKTRKIHNIHNQYIGLLYRYGIVGLGVFLYILVKFYISLKAKLSKEGETGIISYTIYLYFIGTIILMMGFSGFLGDINWGILLGISAGLTNSFQQKNTQPSTK